MKTRHGALLFTVVVSVLPSPSWSQSHGADQVPSSIQRIRDLDDQARQLSSVDMIMGKRPRIDPGGQWQMDKILKAQYEQLAADTDKLRKLTDELKTDLANPNVLSVSSMRKAEEIEKLARKVRSRLRGWF